MLSDHTATPCLAVRDLARARRFYEDTLGFTEQELPGFGDDDEMGVFYGTKNGGLLVYPSSFAGTNKATSVSFQVDDGAFDQEVATLRGHVFSGDDLERRFVIGRILCHGELRASEFEAEFGTGFRARYSSELAALEPFARDGLLEIGDDGSLVLTALGRLLVRNVAMTFDAYLPEQQRSGRRIFSRTV